LHGTIGNWLRSVGLRADGYSMALVEVTTQQTDPDHTTRSDSVVPDSLEAALTGASESSPQEARLASPAVPTVVVLPTYNEAENIGDVLARVRLAVPDALVLVVDDNSPDGTAALAEHAALAFGNIEVIRRPGKAGLGSAYRAGFAWAMLRGAEVLVEMDSDLSHDPASLPALLAAVNHGADLAIGSRYVSGGSIPDWAWHRRWLSRWGNRYAAGVLGLGVRDATAGFRAYRADVLRAIDLDTVRADGYGFQIEMAYRVAGAGGRIVEVPIAFVDRVRGTSKMSGRIVVEALELVTWWGIRDRLLRRRPKRR
jgi:dolichol-phosphate mannosyltransferase